ncbi:hypothetical protein FGB62_95g091 [Gracilaria domingensis]|nr:hypothetical protein FGB62_95g091 [Gracilaria domingensis]
MGIIGDRRTQVGQSHVIERALCNYMRPIIALQLLHTEWAAVSSALSCTHVVDGDGRAATRLPPRARSAYQSGKGAAAAAAAAAASRSPPPAVHRQSAHHVDAQEEPRRHLLAALQGWRVRRQEGPHAQGAPRNQGGAQPSRHADHEVAQVARVRARDLLMAVLLLLPHRRGH